MDIDLLLRSATEAIRRRDLNTARQALSEVLREQPSNANAWFLASYLTDDPTQQVRALDRALLENPNFTQAAVRRDRVRARLAESVPPSMPPSTSSSPIFATSVPEKQLGVGVLALEWFVASVIGWLVVWLILYQWVLDPNNSAKSLLVFGIFIPPALAQWLVFRDAFRAGIWALFANLLSHVVGLLILVGAFGILLVLNYSFDESSQFFLVAIAEAGAIGGFVIALFQLPYLAVWVRLAWLWLLMNMIAMGLHFLVVFGTLTFLFRNTLIATQERFIVGAVIGILVYSGCSTLFFSQLLRWRKPHAFVQALHSSPFQARANAWGCLTFIGFMVMSAVLRVDRSGALCLGGLIMTIVFCLISLHYRRLAYREAAAAVSNTSQPVL